MVEGGLTAAEQRQISRKKYGDSPTKDKEDSPTRDMEDSPTRDKKDSPTRDKEQGHEAGDSPEDHKYYEIK